MIIPPASVRYCWPAPSRSIASSVLSRVKVPILSPRFEGSRPTDGGTVGLALECKVKLCTDEADAARLLFISRARRMGLRCDQIGDLLPIWGGTN